MPRSMASCFRSIACNPKSTSIAKQQSRRPCESPQFHNTLDLQHTILCRSLHGCKPSSLVTSAAKNKRSRSKRSSLTNLQVSPSFNFSSTPCSSPGHCCHDERRMQLSQMPLPPRRWMIAYLVLLLTAYLLLFRLGPAISYLAYPRAHPSILPDGGHHASGQSHLTANLIVASLSKDDISWTSNVQIPNLQILRYVNDDASAEYHPLVLNKGREALMYFTYLYAFYDNLPDISIFVHAEEIPWHVEGTLLQNTTFALSQLELEQVIKRGYFNLRVTWRAACPTWIDTSKTHDNWDKQEEPFMKEAWQANFGDGPPKMLGGPCCSQFAVSRETIQSRPREQYKRSMDWLAETTWSDYIAGRVWEHMWPYLFLNVTKDCTPERPSLCQMYGLCFYADSQVSDYKELWEERERLKEDMSFFRAVYKPGKAAVARQKMDEVCEQIEQGLAEAQERGKDPRAKANIVGVPERVTD